MPTLDPPQIPSQERTDTRDEGYGAVMDALGLNSPLRPSEASVEEFEVSSATDVMHPVGCTSCPEDDELPDERPPNVIRLDDQAAKLEPTRGEVVVATIDGPIVRGPWPWPC